MTAGLVGRYKQLRNGARQIVAILVPGDFCEADASLLHAQGHGMVALSDCKVARVPRSTVDEWRRKSPRLSRALESARSVNEAILREWIVNLGVRSATERAAHLFCELHLRLKATQPEIDDEFDLPLTQGELSEVLGLSVVHVNRTLAALREKRLAEKRYGKVRILDSHGLAEFADFDPGYLRPPAVD